ncbi:AAA family ATPase [Halomonas mongoliensis]|uniref:AAA family ATPase n=1 Tax=Halomonas mongoliensis TaxID=321265 RepID=UPI00403ABAA5
MLESLFLKGVGPAREFGPINFSKRMNFITGDNGLGKSFFLDIAWWALTRTWARGSPAVPQEKYKSPSISFSYTKSTKGSYEDEIFYKKSMLDWPLKQGRPPIPGVVIYAGVDGSFSSWDPARNYWAGKDSDAQNKVRAFNFTPSQVWNGLVSEDGVRHCNGLVNDWVMWQQSGESIFDDLSKVLHYLSPSSEEKLIPGKPVRIPPDVTLLPSLRMPYGQDVAITHASAGMRRIAALTYLLVWTWREHELACFHTGRKKAKEIIILIDEIECHLHPQWQRRIVPALLSVMEALSGKKYRFKF